MKGCQCRKHGDAAYDSCDASEYVVHFFLHCVTHAISWRSWKVTPQVFEVNYPGILTVAAHR
eukprot:4393104-Prymnesium_polylepis.3